MLATQLLVASNQALTSLTLDKLQLFMQLMILIDSEVLATEQLLAAELPNFFTANNPCTLWYLKLLHALLMV